MNLKNSQTAENLMRAFVGESAARNRYTISASEAKKQQLHVIETLFTFTANQEKQHAKIFYSHLSELAGETLHIDAGYPADVYADIRQLLRSAEHNELEEYETVYKSFAETARKEGFESIAASFSMIAEIEKTHSERFKRVGTLLDEGKLFSSNETQCFMCLKCGHIYFGTEAPAICPVCGHDRGFFIRDNFSPFLK